MVDGPARAAHNVREISPEAGQSEREAMYYRYLEFASLVKGGSVQPHWMADGSSFWCAEGSPADTVIYKVDPKANTKTPLFDAARLRQVLTAVLGHEPPYRGLPFAEFSFVNGEKAVKCTVEGKDVILQLDTYSVTQVPPPSEEEKGRLVPRAVRKGIVRHGPDVMEVLSPDRRLFAGVKEHNLWLRSTHDGRSVQITTDGIKDYEWDVEGARWSPDSFMLAVKKVDSRQVPYVPIVHSLKPIEEVEWIHYRRAGGPLPQTQLFIVDILSKRQVRIDIGEEPDQYLHILDWQPDGSELFFLRMNRTLKRLDLMAANPASGTARVILTEIQKTFVIGLQLYYGTWIEWLRLFTLLEDGRRFIWASERDGWNHLYLYTLDRSLLRRLTEGNFPVVRIEAVDEKTGWVYFTAHSDQQRPYDTHLHRVNLDGKGFVRLTDANSKRWRSWASASSPDTIQFALSKEFFLDTHSGVDQPPAVDLRRTDGTLLQTLSKANIDALKELKWTPPEEFGVKAADQKTDLYGVLYKPYDFDPNGKYPVIEEIYAGPYITQVPRTFTEWLGVFHQALAQLGFIVFVVDGRGTPERGKGFQDLVYGNFGRHEIPDHMAALRQLAQQRPYMDLSRVGIFGHSWGGYFAIRAMLLAPDVYHVGIARAPSEALSDYSRS
ncbi:MAG: DPP IV N-terminal domain-containing protein, partial [bacterium]